MSKYSFDHEWGMERERLQHFEALLDPGTIRELEAIGELVISDLPLRLVVIDMKKAEVKKWIPARPTEQS